MTFHNPELKKLEELIFSNQNLLANTFTDPDYDYLPDQEELQYDEQGWSEPIPLVPEIIELLVDDDIIRFSKLDPNGFAWSKAAPFAHNYFAMQIKRRAEPIPEDTSHPTHFLVFSDTSERFAAIPLGRFANDELALEQANLVWPQIKGYVVTVERVRGLLELLEDLESKAQG